MTEKTSFFYYVQMLRIDDWFWGFIWIPPMGVLLVSLSPPAAFTALVVSFCSLAYAYVINNYFDVEIDKKHKRKVKSNKNPLAQNLITPKGVFVVIGILLVVPFVLAALINFYSLVFLGLCIITSTLYSVKHIRLKERTGMDIISHGLMFGLFPFLTGIVLGGGAINILVLFVGFLYFIVTSNALVSHQIIDYEEDLGNTENTIIRVGRKIGFIFLFMFQILLLLCLIVMFKYFVIHWLVYCLFVFLLFLIPFDCIRRLKKVSGTPLVLNPIKLIWKRHE